MDHLDASTLCEAIELVAVEDVVVGPGRAEVARRDAPPDSAQVRTIAIEWHGAAAAGDQLQRAALEGSQTK